MSPHHPLSRPTCEGLIPSNDAWARVQLFRGVERQRLNFLDVPQAWLLLNTCDPALRNFVHAALLTGARYSELCRLEVRDLQLAAGTLYVRPGKSGKARHVVLNTEGQAFFQQLALGRRPLDRLLLRDDGLPWARDLHRRPFKEAVVRAGLDPSFTFHELRHTWASLSIMAGAPLIVVARNLGHCDTRMVETHYGHLADTYVAEVVRRTAPSFGLSKDRTLIVLHQLIEDSK